MYKTYTKPAQSTAICQSVSLSRRQQVFLKPALACLQLGATFFLADLIKPYIVPLLMISVGIVSIIALQVLKDGGSWL